MKRLGQRVQRRERQVQATRDDAIKISVRIDKRSFKVLIALASAIMSVLGLILAR